MQNQNAKDSIERWNLTSQPRFWQVRSFSSYKHGLSNVFHAFFAAIDECETQAYGMEDDAVRHSDDEDCPTQAYGIMDLPTFPYEEATDSLTGNSNRRTGMNV